MGDFIKESIRPLKQLGRAVLPGGEEAEKLQREQRKQIAKQRQRELLRRAESESEVARRRGLAQRPGGRSLLVATTPTGVEKLGGT